MFLQGDMKPADRLPDAPDEWYEVLAIKSYQQYDLTDSKDYTIFLGLLSEDAISDIKLSPSAPPHSLLGKRLTSSSLSSSLAETFTIPSTKDQGDTFLYSMLCSPLVGQPSVHEAIPSPHPLV
jgi:hypothetical protein